MSKNLLIEAVENGFIVTEDNPPRGLINKRWAFEDSSSLALFTKEWAQKEKEKNSAEQ